MAEDPCLYLDEADVEVLRRATFGALHGMVEVDVDLLVKLILDWRSMRAALEVTA